MRVLALDAAMPFDFEHRMRARMQPQNITLKVGIVGFGTFGQFLAKRFVKAGHQVSIPTHPHSIGVVTLIRLVGSWSFREPSCSCRAEAAACQASTF